MFTFKKASGCIHPEPVHSEVEPEGESILQTNHNFRVAQVQIGLFGVVLVQIVLPACCVQRPSGSPEDTFLKLIRSIGVVHK